MGDLHAKWVVGREAARVLAAEGLALKTLRSSRGGWALPMWLRRLGLVVVPLLTFLLLACLAFLDELLYRLCSSALFFSAWTFVTWVPLRDVSAAATLHPRQRERGPWGRPASSHVQPEPYLTLACTAEPPSLSASAHNSRSQCCGTVLNDYERTRLSRALALLPLLCLALELLLLGVGLDVFQTEQASALSLNALSLNALSLNALSYAIARVWCSSPSCDAPLADEPECAHPDGCSSTSSSCTRWFGFCCRGASMSCDGARGGAD